MFSAKHKLQFEQAWRAPIKINPSIEDVVPEVDLPRDLSKLKPNQEIQIVNVFKHLDREDIQRRWKLINIALNLSHARHKQKDIDAWSKISDLVYKSKMIKRQGVEASVEEASSEIEEKQLWTF
jgi:hypothetical protein